MNEKKVKFEPKNVRQLKKKWRKKNVSEREREKFFASWVVKRAMKGGKLAKKPIITVV